MTATFEWRNHQCESGKLIIRTGNIYVMPAFSATVDTCSIWKKQGWVVRTMWMPNEDRQAFATGSRLNRGKLLCKSSYTLGWSSFSADDNYTKYYRHKNCSRTQRQLIGILWRDGWYPSENSLWNIRLRLLESDWNVRKDKIRIIQMENLW